MLAPAFLHVPGASQQSQVCSPLQISLKSPRSPTCVWPARLRCWCRDTLPWLRSAMGVWQLLVWRVDTKEPWRVESCCRQHPEHITWGQQSRVLKGESFPRLLGAEHAGCARGTAGWEPSPGEGLRLALAGQLQAALSASGQRQRHGVRGLRNRVAVFVLKRVLPTPRPSFSIPESQLGRGTSSRCPPGKKGGSQNVFRVITSVRARWMRVAVFSCSFVPDSYWNTACRAVFSLCISLFAWWPCTSHPGLVISLWSVTAYTVEDVCAQQQ